MNNIYKKLTKGGSSGVTLRPESSAKLEEKILKYKDNIDSINVNIRSEEDLANIRSADMQRYGVNPNATVSADKNGVVLNIKENCPDALAQALAMSDTLHSFSSINVDDALEHLANELKNLQSIMKIEFAKQRADIDTIVNKCEQLNDRCDQLDIAISSKLIAEPQIEVPDMTRNEENARENNDQEQHTSEPLGSNTLTTNDALVTQKTIVEACEVPRTITHSAYDGLEPTIKNFLSKPFMIEQGAFGINDLPTSFNQWFTSIAMRLNPAFNSKVQAALALRYTTVVTLQVNANRFQQGIYKLCYLPTGGMPINEPETNDWLLMHRANRCQISQLFSADVNLSSDTSCQLKIPYSSAYTGTSFTPNLATRIVGDPGYFFIYPYSVLKAPTGNQAASFTLWVHYEDVEIMGNTAPNVGPEPPRPAPATLVAEAQSGIKKRSARKNQDFIADEQRSEGPVTGGLRVVTQSLEALNGVPLLSTYTQPLSWVTAAMTKAAAVFGWSKPVIVDKVTRVKSQYHNYIANADQVDDCQPLALMSTNHINVAPGFAGTDSDEMAIDYLKSIYGCFNVVNWTTALPTGTELFKFDLSPNDFIYSGPGAGTALSYPPVSYVGTFFDQYTGGFDIRIKLSKTEFHSGRLLFVFNPYESNLATENYTFNDTVYLTKTILDIRETTEFTMRVPYVSIPLWRPIRSTRPGSYSSKFGSVKVYVLDVLVAPDTVQQDIDLFFEVAGSPDLRFSVPCSFPLVPQVPAEAQSGINLSRNVEHDQINTLSADFVGANNTVDTNLDKEQYSVGESITSLRQLLKRGGFMAAFNQVVAGNSLQVLPWAWTYAKATDIMPGNFTSDPYSKLATVFAIQRGGIRLRYLSDTNSGGIYGSVFRGIMDTDSPISTIISNTTYASFQDFIRDSAGSQMFLEKGYFGGFSVQIPFYHYNPGTCSGSQTVATGKPYKFQILNNTNVNRLNLWNSEAWGASPPALYRSGADDCSFGAFCSVPPMVANEVPPAPPP